jgi:hypothetical protein
MNKKTKIQFITTAKEVHNNKYNYSKVEYIKAREKVCIICPEHGEFWQSPDAHIHSHSCPKCSKLYNYNTQEWIEKAIEIHSNKYVYSKSEYINTKTKVCIICPEHGEFYQKPNNHLQGQGCIKCSIKNNSKKQRKKNEDFINESNIIHSYRYDYSKVEYINNHTKVCIICPEHGEFYQKPFIHLKGCGCSKCSKKYNYTSEEYIKKCIKIHGEIYDYSITKYKNAYTKIKVICLDCGEFNINPRNHINGMGCPLCNMSSGEKIISKFLNTKNIKFEYKYRKFEWLKNRMKMEIDFFLNDYNIGIEFQGGQHFKSIEHWGGIEGLKKIQENDKIKQILCNKNNIPLYYINHNENIIDKLNEICYNLIK